MMASIQYFSIIGEERGVIFFSSQQTPRENRVASLFVGFAMNLRIKSLFSSPMVSNRKDSKARDGKRRRYAIGIRKVRVPQLHERGGTAARDGGGNVCKRSIPRRTRQWS